MTELVITVGSTNLAQQTGWSVRKPLVVEKFKKVIRASVYLLSECDWSMAQELALAMGWGSSGQPCWRTDENRNTVMWDPAKRRDLKTVQESLSREPKDLGDRHYRSVCWVLLEDLETRQQVWMGASHLSNNGSNAWEARAARAEQAEVLVETLPGTPAVLGIDRNSLDSSEPDRVLSSALQNLTVGMPDSFLGNGFQPGVGAIDSVYGAGVSAQVTRVDMGKATDHSAYRARVTIYQPTAN